MTIVPDVPDARAEPSAAAKEWWASNEVHTRLRSMLINKLPVHWLSRALEWQELDAQEAYDAGAAAEREAILREMDSLQSFFESVGKPALGFRPLRDFIQARQEAP